MDDNNELVIYVLQQLRYGVPEQAVRANLAQNGWPQPLIDRAFSMVQQAAPHNLPASNSYPQAQTATPVSDLPSPADNPFPAIETQKREESKGKTRRVLLITFIIVFLLGLASFAGFLIYKAIQQHDNAEKPATSSQQKSPEKKKEANLDGPRKQNLESLAEALNTYYGAKQTYPTLAQLNSAEFATTEGNVDESKFTDPSWDATKSECINAQTNKAILTEVRTANCFSYRATATNGGDCDGDATKCTRIVLTANLKGDKPYVIAFDEGTRE